MKTSLSVRFEHSDCVHMTVNGKVLSAKEIEEYLKSLSPISIDAAFVVLNDESVDDEPVKERP